MEKCWQEVNDNYYEFYCPTVYYTPEGTHAEKDDYSEFDFSDESQDDVKELTKF